MQISRERDEDREIGMCVKCKVQRSCMGYLCYRPQMPQLRQSRSGRGKEANWVGCEGLYRLSLFFAHRCHSFDNPSRGITVVYPMGEKLVQALPGVKGT